MDLTILLATCAASLGASVMHENYDAATYGGDGNAVDLYRTARMLNRQGRRSLAALGASSVLALEEVLIG